MEEEDIDLAVAKWTDRVLSAAKTHIPNKTIRVRHRDSPWF